MTYLQPRQACTKQRSAVSPHVSQQLLNGDRQVPHSLPCGVIHGICDGRRYGYRSEFTQTLCADRARFVIELAHEQDVEFRNIRTGRHEVTRVIAVDEASSSRISFRLLHQGLADTPDNSANRLAACSLGIDDLAAVVGAHKAVHTHEPEVRINAYLGEDRREAESGFRSFGTRVVVSLTGQGGQVIAN